MSRTSGLEMRMPRWIATGLLCIIGVVSGTSKVQGQARPCPEIRDVQAESERARELRKARTTENDQVAFEMLTCLYSQAPIFDVLIQLYQAELNIGRWVEAWEHFQAAQKDPAFAQLMLIPDFQKQVTEDQLKLTQHVGRIEVLVKDANTQRDISSGNLLIDGAPWTPLPMTSARDIVAGSRQIKVDAPDYVSQTRKVDVRALVEQPLNRETFVLTKVIPLWKRPGLWVGIGAGVAAVVALGVGLGVGLQRRPDADLTWVF